MTRMPRQKLARNFRRRLKSLKLSIKEARPELSYKLRAELYNVREPILFGYHEIYIINEGKTRAVEKMGPGAFNNKLLARRAVTRQNNKWSINACPVAPSFLWSHSTFTNYRRL